MFQLFLSFDLIYTVIFPVAADDAVPAVLIKVPVKAHCVAIRPGAAVRTGKWYHLSATIRPMSSFLLIRQDPSQNGITRGSSHP